MIDNFHCKLCDESYKIKYKKKHLDSQHRQALTKNIIS